MKHYIPKDTQKLSVCPVEPGRHKTHHIDVFVPETDAIPSTDMIVDFYRALNELVEGHAYTVNLKRFACEAAGNPLYWSGRTAIFWGDVYKHWRLSPDTRAWTSQVLSLAPRTILVGGAALLLARVGRSDGAEVAVHPNFAAAAQENGLMLCETATHMSTGGRLHSAATRLGTLKLLSEFVSIDHGAYIAESLREYIGLSDPGPKHQSPLATRLIQRSGADPLVTRAVETMLGHIEDPLKIPDISRRLGTSTRQLQRRFLGKTGAKLLCTYRALRLERAYSLLRHTDMSPLEIAAATGFTSITSMGRSFRSMYRDTPDKVRRQRFSGCLSQP